MIQDSDIDENIEKIETRLPTNFQKLTSNLYRIFIREQKLSPEISQAVVTGSYFQIFSVVNVTLLFTVFSNTNSNVYTYVISSLTIVLLLLDIFPKISKRHLVFNFVSIGQGLAIVGMLISSKILLDNYLIFTAHCETFKAYHSDRKYIIGPKNDVLAMCDTVSAKFLAQIMVEASFLLGKCLHVFLYVRAYRQAKEKFQDEEKKRRRKDRYNEMMRRRYIFNQKRKA